MAFWTYIKTIIPDSIISLTLHSNLSLRLSLIEENLNSIWLPLELVIILFLLWFQFRIFHYYELLTIDKIRLKEKEKTCVMIYSIDISLLFTFFLSQYLLSFYLAIIFYFSIILIFQVVCSYFLFWVPHELFSIIFWRFFIKYDY